MEMPSILTEDEQSLCLNERRLLGVIIPCFYLQNATVELVDSCLKEIGIVPKDAILIRQVYESLRDVIVFHYAHTNYTQVKDYEHLNLIALRKDICKQIAECIHGHHGKRPGLVPELSA